MAPMRKSGKRAPLKKYFKGLTVQDLLNITKDVLFEPKLAWILACCLLFAEIFVNIIVIRNVKYTEIDWEAYMEEVEGFLNGTYDYYQLKGATGPLVYPAGFVYIFSGFYFLTSHGLNIRLAQYMFAVLYIAFLVAVFYLYHRSKTVPPYAFFFLCCASYRIHSIFILRLFNDPVAMFLFYVSLCCMFKEHWNVGCILYSLAVSVKMNILLFAPGLLLVLLNTFGLPQAVLKISLCGLVQILLGLPFLLTNPVAYVARSFDLGRQFLFTWTVNWRFLPEWLFLNRYFHLVLLLLHIITLVTFWIKKWPRPASGWSSLLTRDFVGTKLDATSILEVLFASNFIGMCFSRSLHYQFYVWYFHTLPFLLWRTDLITPVKILILGLLELCWNTYPSTSASSLTIHACHLIIIIGLYVSKQKQKTT